MSSKDNLVSATSSLPGTDQPLAKHPGGREQLHSAPLEASAIFTAVLTHAQVTHAHSQERQHMNSFEVVLLDFLVNPDDVSSSFFPFPTLSQKMQFKDAKYASLSEHSIWKTHKHM